MLLRSTAILAALITGIPLGARAQYLEWLGVCTPGSITGCANVSLTTHYRAAAFDGMGATDIVVTFRNLQGSYGYEYLAPTSLHRLVFAGLDADIDGFEGNSAGTRGVETEGDTFWMESWGRFGGAGTIGFHLFGVMGQPLWGCDVGDFPSDLPHGQTCERGAVYTRTIRGAAIRVTPETNLSIRAVAWADPESHPWGEGVTCTTGIDCITLTSVPEPSTWIMLATGLLGIAIVRWRREIETE